jgi:hypothetical protein
MSSLDIAPRPEGAPTRVQDRCRTRRRHRVSFRRAGICTVWRLGFRQSSFHHIARVSRRTVPDTWTRSPVSWHALVPLTFQRRVSHQTQGPPSNPSRLEPGIQRSASRRTTLMPLCVRVPVDTCSCRNDRCLVWRRPYCARSNTRTRGIGVRRRVPRPCRRLDTPNGRPNPIGLSHDADHTRI